MYSPEVEQGMLSLTKDAYLLDWKIRKYMAPDKKVELGKRLKDVLSSVHDMHGFGQLQKVDVDRYQQLLTSIQDSFDRLTQSRPSGLLLSPPLSPTGPSYTGRRSVDGRT